ncbi:hypothetical protein [Acinetobacter sp. UBA2581]|uniref:hypothetical protein n=1 Tax=Acinetobacter sp. UBA2581 TaxID=1945932 RepID=UPI0025795EA4|nr:hypothetical protein [Acinetobacter sp. UBA2581]
MKLLPIVGIDNTSHDDALTVGGQSPAYFMRDIINFDISDRGSAELRKSGRKVSDRVYTKLWQSPLHKDVFGMDHVGMLYKVDPISFSGTELGQVGHDANFEVVNNLVYIAGSLGIFTFNGAVLNKITLDAPGYPFLMKDAGSLSAGQYGVAISYLSGDIESELSRTEFISVEGDAGIRVTVPLIKGEGITGVNVYITSSNGTELYLYGRYAADAVEVNITAESSGRPANFQHLSKMPSGQFLTQWQGRLVTADKNMLHFSQSMTYHLTDARYDYVRLPQRISFVVGVEGGLWVGQVDKVVFLRGTSPDNFTFEVKTAQAPIKGTAITLDNQDAGEVGQGGGRTALWLASNGLCMGSNQGQLIEMQSKHIQGVSGQSGRCVGFDGRITTIIK